jgi:coatomer subunit beta
MLTFIYFFSNKWRQDLLHPNEYIRGVTARLLSKMRYVKILQPLLEPIAQNIKHSHVYVRRNALMCLYSMISCFGCNFISTAIEDVEAFLSSVRFGVHREIIACFFLTCY